MRYLVIRNAGHGDATPGKRTPDTKGAEALERADGTVHEHDFNDAVNKMLGMLCFLQGIETYDPAPTGEDTPLHVRTKRANDFAEAFLDRYAGEQCTVIWVGIHANALNGQFDNKSGGVETYYYTGSDAGERLATAVHNQLKIGTPQVDRGVKHNTWMWELKATSMTAILAECCFMDAKDEFELMLSPTYQCECAINIFDGILEYFGLTSAVNTIFMEQDHRIPVMEDCIAKIEQALAETRALI